MAAETFPDFIREVGQAPPSGYASLLGDLAGAPAQVADLLRGYAIWRQDTDVTSGKSHLHNNGFLKLSLWRHPKTAASLRVHVWKPSAARRERQAGVHDHRWDFASVVLAGRLRFVNFEAAATPTGAWLLHKVSDADERGDKRVELLAECSLRETTAYELLPGCVHRLDHCQLHSTPPPDAFAVTLVLTAPPARDYSHVVMRRTDAPRGSVSSARALTAEDELAEIADVIGRLDAA